MPRGKKRSCEDTVRETIARINNGSKRTANLTGPTGTSEFAIKYDEYMEGGIPDTLLEGLGFGEAQAPQDDDVQPMSLDGLALDARLLAAGAAAAMDPRFQLLSQAAGIDPRLFLAGVAPSLSALGVPSTVASSNSGTTAQSSSSGLRRSGRTPSTSRSVPQTAPRSAPPAHQSSAPRSAAPHLRTPGVASTSRLQQPSMPRSASQAMARQHRIAPRTVVKGNIVYERTATGEIIASIVKNGNNASGATPVVGQSGGGTSQQSAQQSSRGMNQGNRYPQQRGPSHQQSMPPLPEHCPIDEARVDDVLERSMQATQCMRQLLGSLKDDLRRMGGGPTMSPALKPVHVQKRREVAERLARALADYQRSLDEIGASGMAVLVKPDTAEGNGESQKNICKSDEGQEVPVYQAEDFTVTRADSGSDSEAAVAADTSKIQSTDITEAKCGDAADGCADVEDSAEKSAADKQQLTVASD